MPFDILTFVLDKFTAARQGVSDQRSTELGLVGAMLPLGPIPSLVITQVIAQNEAGSATPVAAPPVIVSSSGQVQVPDVTQKRFNEASAVLQLVGLQVQRQDVLSTTVPKDQVISQDPAATTIVATDTLVTLSVNPGVPVLDVTGQTLETAESLLGLLGLTDQPVQRPSDVVNEGIVISQNPAPDTRVSPGDTVQLVVSSGVALVTLPDVVTKQPTGDHFEFSEAREILQDLDFIVNRVDIAVTDPKQYEKVQQQDPAPGAYPRETQVTLTVGTAPSSA